MIWPTKSLTWISQHFPGRLGKLTNAAEGQAEITEWIKTELSELVSESAKNNNNLFDLRRRAAAAIAGPPERLKVRQSREHFFKPTFPPKNKQTNSTLLLWNRRSTCFHMFFGEKIEDTKN